MTEELQSVCEGGRGSKTFQVLLFSICVELLRTNYSHNTHSIQFSSGVRWLVYKLSEFVREELH
jgi:hypothetical protein